MDSAGPDYDAINDYVRNLTYNPDEQLAYTGEKITSFKKKIGALNRDNSYVVVSRKLRSVDKGRADIGVLTNSESTTFPGQLFVANENLVNNNPTVVMADRADLVFTVNLPGLDKDASFVTYPDFEHYKSGLDQVLKTYFTRYPPDSHQGVESRFTSEHFFVHSKDELRVRLGLEVRGTSFESSTDFDAVTRDEKTIMISKFSQVFFTVSVSLPHNPADLFGPRVSLQELKRKFDSTKPPALVSSVSYGRQIYVKIETTSTGSETKAALEGYISQPTSASANISSELNKTHNLENFKMDIMSFGGSDGHIYLLETESREKIDELLIKYGKFGPGNVGLPLSFKTVFIKDNAVATVKCSTQYVETTREVFTSGTIDLEHRGWFIVSYQIEWDEVVFDEGGKASFVHRTFHDNNRNILAPYVGQIHLNGNTENIDISVWVRGFFSWYKVVEQRGIPLVRNRKLIIDGWLFGVNSRFDPPL